MWERNRPFPDGNPSLDWGGATTPPLRNYFWLFPCAVACALPLLPRAVSADGVVGSVVGAVASLAGASGCELGTTGSALGAGSVAAWTGLVGVAVGCADLVLCGAERLLAAIGFECVDFADAPA
jgi:hypothetical protein